VKLTSAPIAAKDNCLRTTTVALGLYSSYHTGYPIGITSSYHIYKQASIVYPSPLQKQKQVPYLTTYFFFPSLPPDRSVQHAGVSISLCTRGARGIPNSEGTRRSSQKRHKNASDNKTTSRKCIMHSKLEATKLFPALFPPR